MYVYVLQSNSWPNRYYVGITKDLKNLEHVTSGDLVATGHLLKLGKKIATATVEATQGDKMIAFGSGSFALTQEPIPI